MAMNGSEQRAPSRPFADQCPGDCGQALATCRCVPKTRRSDEYHHAVINIIRAARVLREVDMDLEDREAIRAALRRARLI